jgi:hypothetical protein
VWNNNNLHAYWQILKCVSTDIGGAVKRACLGDTYIYGGLHGRLGPAHVGRHFVHERV